MLLASRDRIRRTSRFPLTASSTFAGTESAATFEAIELRSSSPIGRSAVRSGPAGGPSGTHHSSSSSPISFFDSEITFSAMAAGISS